MVVVDSSVLVNACGDDQEAGDAARRRLASDPDAHAPHLVDIEVLSALRRWAARGTISLARALEAIDDLADVPLQRWNHVPLARRVWELRDNVTPYDASYVALAETFGCPLVTNDRRLARVRGLGCEVELLSP